MRLLLIGPPGSGKGTQAERISARFGIPHLSSGELLRQEVERATEIGLRVKDLLARGDLVPDDIVMDILRRPVEDAARAGGYILDGFPRTVAQARAAYLVARQLNASVQIALNLEVPHEQLVARTLARRRAAGRMDDTEQVLAHRLEVFDTLTRPLLDYYARREMLITVDGDRPVDEVTATIFAELDAARSRLA